MGREEGRYGKKAPTKKLKGEGKRDQTLAIGKNGTTGQGPVDTRIEKPSERKQVSRATTGSREKSEKKQPYSLNPSNEYVIPSGRKKHFGKSPKGTERKIEGVVKSTPIPSRGTRRV